MGALAEGLDRAGQEQRRLEVAPSLRWATAPVTKTTRRVEDISARRPPF